MSASSPSVSSLQLEVRNLSETHKKKVGVYFSKAEPDGIFDIGILLMINYVALLFRREVAEDNLKLREFCKSSCELRKSVRKRDRYIDELKMSKGWDEIAESIDIMRRMQLDDIEKASRLLLMARETHLKIHEKRKLIIKLIGQVVA
ncbi:hypothetical protein Tco_0836370 [Tanacetum coccineum]